MILTSGLAVYNVSANLFATSASLEKQPTVKRHPFTYCFQDHPCHQLPTNCTAGHILDVQFGGASHCYNCAPQSPLQQVVHSYQLECCFARSGRMRVDIQPSGRGCGYDFSYACSPAASIAVALLLPSWWVVLGLLVHLGVRASALHLSGRYIEPPTASGLVPTDSKSAGIAYPYVNLRKECTYLLTTSSLWPSECVLPASCGPELHSQRLAGAGLASETDICFRVPQVSDVYITFAWGGGVGRLAVPGAGVFTPIPSSLPILGVHPATNSCGVYVPGSERHALHYEQDSDKYFYPDELFNIPRQCHWENTTATFHPIDCGSLIARLPSGTVVIDYESRSQYLRQVPVEVEDMPLAVRTLGEVTLGPQGTESLLVEGPVRLAGESFTQGIYVTHDAGVLHYYPVAHNRTTGKALSYILAPFKGAHLRVLVAQTCDVHLEIVTPLETVEIIIDGWDCTKSQIRRGTLVHNEYSGQLLLANWNAIHVSLFDNILDVTVNGRSRLSTPLLSAEFIARYSTGWSYAGTWKFLDTERALYITAPFTLALDHATPHWIAFQPGYRGIVAEPLLYNSTCVRALSVVSDVGWVEGLLLKLIGQLEALLVQVFSKCLELVAEIIRQAIYQLLQTAFGLKLVEICVVALCVHLQYLNLPLTGIAAAIAAVFLHM